MVFGSCRFCYKTELATGNSRIKVRDTRCAWMSDATSNARIVLKNMDADGLILHLLQKEDLRRSSFCMLL